MLTDLVIENFQSVQEAHLHLGMFTVITGPTGSGKSATLRALRLAAFNKRGAAFIRQGTALAKAGFGSQAEGWFIGIERGGRGKDIYRVARPSGLLEGIPGTPGDGVEVQSFTKLAGEAPPEVLALHGLTALNFAGQFDSPFLLSASSSEVARILGELTNVNLIYEAAREGARRRGRISSELKRAETEAASLAEQLQQYASLPARIAAQERAEQALGVVRKITGAMDRLQGLCNGVAVSAEQSALARDVVSASAPPSLEAAEALLQRHQRLSALTAELRSSWEEQSKQQKLAVSAEADERALHSEIHAALEEAGTCPTCGQEILQDS